MKIIILNPPYKEKMVKEGRCQQRSDLLQTIYPPLEAAYIAAILRKRVDVRILDCIGRGVNKEELIRIYRKEKPDKVFVNTATQTINNDLRIISELNKVSPSKFILFGVYASYFRRRFSKLRNVTVPKSVIGYAYKIIGEKKAQSLDKLPFPAWDLVNLNDYRLPVTGKKFVLVQTAVGCPYSCIFCTVPFYHGRKILRRSVESVIEEIDYVLGMGVKDIIFFADTFTLDKEWVKRLCKEIISKKTKIRFLCNSRIDCVDKATLRLMKMAGCWLISFGIESGNQHLLDTAKKGIWIEDVRKAVKAANREGILTLGNFVIGLPGENVSSIKKTIDFSKELRLDFAAFNIATPFPGSALYETCKDKKIDWERLQYSSQVVSPELDLEYWQKKAYRSFYYSRPITRLMRILSIAGSNNPGVIVRSALNLWRKVLR